MKVTQESPDTFKPVTITLETREELDLLANAIDGAIDYMAWTEENACKLRAFYNNLFNYLPNA